ncbi:MAG: hypothetical protein IJT00_03915 [Lachnospiraceae bacterium]|nr:hypothetical protein [Lachnospiraceae bacterium]
MSSVAIAEELGINRHTVELWVQKYRNRTKDQDLMSLLSVSEGRGRKEEITGEAKTWLISIACMKPKDLGYAAEIWTTSALTKHINKVAKDAGYERHSGFLLNALFQLTSLWLFLLLHISLISTIRFIRYCHSYQSKFNSRIKIVLTKCLL